MDFISSILIIFYVIAIIILAIFGLHRYFIVYLYYKYKNNPPRPKAYFQALPKVTVQLPIYNEIFVVERLISSVCQLDYPRELLEIQVLDDSTDATQKMASKCVEEQERKGFDIKYLHRKSRDGFKAGALSFGLGFAKGEYIAIFDADFLPEPK